MSFKGTVHVIKNLLHFLISFLRAWLGLTPVRNYSYKEFYKHSPRYKKFAPLFDFIFDLYWATSISYITAVRNYSYKEFYRYGPRYKKFAPLFDLTFASMARLPVVIDLS
jgi:hypothetical protein